MTDAKDLATRLRNAALPGTNRHALDSLVADLIEQQAAEIALLEFQRDGANEAAERWREQFMQARADAERYRWLRDKSSVSWRLYVDELECFKFDYDAAIDAAMKGTT